MKNFLILTLIGLLISSCSVLAYEKHYIKNSKGQTTGYTKTYSNGKTVQYNKKGQVEYTYKKDGADVSACNEATAPTSDPVVESSK